MSYRALFGRIVRRLYSRDWSGEVRELVRLLIDVLSSEDPIELDAAVRLNNNTDESAIQVYNKHPAGKDKGIRIENADGEAISLGIGLGSYGVVASELVPLLDFALDPAEVEGRFSTLGHKASEKGTTGYKKGTSGSGQLGKHRPFQPVGGLGAALASWQRYTGNQAPSSTTDQLTFKGNPLYLIRDLLGYMVVRCTIDAVNADTLLCTIAGTNTQIEVARDYTLQRTPFDGKTINGVTYNYSDNQTRTAIQYGYTPETQIIYPSYDTGSEVYVRWSKNGTSVDGVYWVDLNTAGRHWVAQ